MWTLVRLLKGHTHEETIKLEITKAVNRLTSPTLNAVFTFQPESFEDLATTICLRHPEPHEDGYLTNDVPEVTFSGPIVWNALFRAHKASLYAELTHLLSIFSLIPQSHGYGGWLWEQWVHTEMVKGGTFTLSRMYSQGPTRPTRQMSNVDEVEEPSSPFTISIEPPEPYLLQ